MKYLELPIGNVFPNPEQPRKAIRSIKTLAGSIGELGLIEPIVVEQVSPKKFIIVSGERRWTACKSLGWKTISAKIDPEPCVEKMLAENLVREEMCLIEKIGGIAKVLEKKCGPDWKKELGRVHNGFACKHTAKIKKFCKCIGLAPTTVYQCLPVLALSKVVQKRILENLPYFTDGVVRKLASLREEKLQIQVSSSIVSGKMTSGEAMREIYKSSFSGYFGTSEANWHYFWDSWKKSCYSLRGKLQRIISEETRLPKDKDECKRFLTQVSEIKGLCSEILKSQKARKRQRLKAKRQHLLQSKHSKKYQKQETEILK